MGCFVAHVLERQRLQDDSDGGDLPEAMPITKDVTAADARELCPIHLHGRKR